jgi:MATE family multidrug resistance protein
MIQQAGMEYFTILACGNFLFPLGVALSSFYLGRGKTLFVTTMMLVGYALHLLLSWVLIFGFGGIPSLGIKGAALGKCLGLGFSCCIFFIAFLLRKNRDIYGTNCWQFSSKALWSYMRPGMVRAFGYLSSKFWWVAVSYFMIKKGGQYLDALTIGGTIIAFLTFASTGLYRAILAISSNLLGAKNYSEISRLCRSFMICTVLIGVILMIPLFWFPNSLIYFFDSSAQEVFRGIFGAINHWVWLYMVAITIQMSLCALIVSAQDLKLQFYCYLLCGLSSFVPVYLMMYLGTLQADKLWLIMAFENVVLGAIFFFRYRQKNRLEIPQLKRG